MHYVIIDESGRFADPKTQAIVFAGISTNVLVGLDKIIPKVRKKIPLKGARKKEFKLAEIKFSTTGDKTRKTVLEEVNKLDSEIYLLLIEPQGRIVKDNPDNYATLVVKLLSQIIKKNPKLKHVIIDRHFTWIHQRELFNELVQKKLGKQLFIEHLDSQQNTVVSLADFVAGGIRQYHTKADVRWRSIIKKRIVYERKVFWKDIVKQKR